MDAYIRLASKGVLKPPIVVAGITQKLVLLFSASVTTINYKFALFEDWVCGFGSSFGSKMISMDEVVGLRIWLDYVLVLSIYYWGNYKDRNFKKLREYLDLLDTLIIDHRIASMDDKDIVGTTRVSFLPTIATPSVAYPITITPSVICLDYPKTTSVMVPIGFTTTGTLLQIDETTSVSNFPVDVILTPRVCDGMDFIDLSASAAEDLVGANAVLLSSGGASRASDVLLLNKTRKFIWPIFYGDTSSVLNFFASRTSSVRGTKLHGIFTGFFGIISESLVYTFGPPDLGYYLKLGISCFYFCLHSHFSVSSLPSLIWLLLADIFPTKTFPLISKYVATFLDAYTKFKLQYPIASRFLATCWFVLRNIVLRIYLIFGITEWVFCHLAYYLGFGMLLYYSIVLMGGYCELYQYYSNCSLITSWFKLAILHRLAILATGQEEFGRCFC
jgi:hypothetical protein